MNKSYDEAATTPNIESQAKKRAHRSSEDAIVLDSILDAPIPKQKREGQKHICTAKQCRLNNPLATDHLKSLSVFFSFS